MRSLHLLVCVSTPRSFESALLRIRQTTPFYTDRKPLHGNDTQDRCPVPMRGTGITHGDRSRGFRSWRTVQDRAQEVLNFV